MLIEEYRFHVSFSSPLGFWMFPIFSGVGSLLFLASYSRLSQSLGDERLRFSIDLMLFLYGLSVGGFAFMGREAISKRRGKYNFIVATPTFLPLRYRDTLLGLYLRDLIFYQALVMLPMAVGGLLALPFSPVSAPGAVLLFIPMEAAFILALSLAFLLSVVFVRSPAAFAAAGVFLLALPLVVHALTGNGALSLPPYAVSAATFSGDAAEAAFLLAGNLLLSLCMVVAAYLLVPRVWSDSARARENLFERAFHFAGGEVAPLLSREYVELRRSWAALKMVLSFTVPLFFLTLSIWYINNGVDLLPPGIRFGTLFYSGMVGFFGVLIYSWLVALDPLDYLNTLPVSVPMVIRAKLRSFMVLTLGISSLFLLGVAVLNDEVGSLVVAWPLMLFTSVYSVTMTAHLTGLRTNSMLFDFPILAKWTLLSALPGVGIAVISFSFYTNPFLVTTIILGIMSMLALATYLFYRDIDRKWGHAHF